MAALPKLLLAGVLGAAVSGCSSLTDMLSPSDIDPPAELQDIQSTVNANTLWSADLGGDSADQRLHLVPVLRDGILYAAQAEGEVRALDAQTGRELWSVTLDQPLSGGPGIGEGVLVLGTLEAEVIALDMSNGSERWRARVSSEVLSAPMVSQGRVIARSIDGQIAGLDVLNGQRVWGFSREIPVLTLRGASSPVISGANVLCGLAGGRLVALDAKTGALSWEAIVAVPGGRSELQRIADVDGDPLVKYGLAFVATYQGELAAVSENTGSVIWRRKFSSYSGMAASEDLLFAADADGAVWALNVDNGGSLWKTEALRNRQLSSLAWVNGVVAVGDFEGYVHFISPKDGSLVGRTRVGKAAISRGMLAQGERLYVLGDGGAMQAIAVSVAP